ncbi:MAG TPA: hypothetical protein VGF32_08800 [Streptosporangiaceae bacterium]|jgi:hypothetical protein
MSVLDAPRRTTPARLMAAVRSAGLHWAVRAGLNEAGLLTTVVTRTGQGGAVTFRVPDPAPRGRHLVSMWIDRSPGTPRTPALLLLHATPDVVRASAVLASGRRYPVRLSPAIDEFRIRFGAVPLPEEDPLTAVEIHSRLRGVRLIELWRPPRRPDRVR